MSAPEDWLTTEAAGKRLGVASGVIANWVRLGRLRGRKDGDRWLVDPSSVDEELARVSRASWWRRVDLPERQAQQVQAVATKRLLKAATDWRADPRNPALEAALIEAVDERQNLIIRAKKPAGGADAS